MINKPSLHAHALLRLQERFGVDGSWLIGEIAQGRFVWLKGAGDAWNWSKVRSGHLIYISSKDEYCVVVMDDRSRLAITVLTEEMARKSSWAVGLTEASKLKAKKISLGKLHDSNFLHAYAKERSGLRVSVRVRTFSTDWNSIILTLLKIVVQPDDIDLSNNTCVLLVDQMSEISSVINCKVAIEEMQPYGQIFVSTSNGKQVSVKGEFPGMLSLEEGEQIRRWHSFDD